MGDSTQTDSLISAIGKTNNKDDGDTLAQVSMTWDPSVEQLLARWCDEAKCFEWMHVESFNYYDGMSRILAISSNILTAIGGVSNMVAGGYTINGFQLAWAFGGVSVLISIANMLQEKLAYASKSVEHDQRAIQWGRIKRKIEEEISVPPASRRDCGTFLKYIRHDINAVSTGGNSMIPGFILKKCMEKFGKLDDFEVPEICGKMEHTHIYIRAPYSVS
jgi:hypothetical protein